MRSISAIQDWRRETISLCGRTGGRKLFDMDSRKPLNEDLEDDDEYTNEESSTVRQNRIVTVAAVMMKMSAWHSFWSTKILRKQIW